MFEYNQWVLYNGKPAELVITEMINILSIYRYLMVLTISRFNHQRLQQLMYLNLT